MIPDWKRPAMPIDPLSAGTRAVKIPNGITRAIEARPSRLIIRSIAR
jgi:hypothetical protein